MLKVKNIKLLNGKVLSLDAKAGEVIFVKGANGAGKSLFLKSLARLIPATSEELSLDNKSALTYPVELWRSMVLYLPPEVCFGDELTVEEYLAEPFSLLRYKDFKAEFDPRNYLTGLDEKMNLLSSGQIQRVALLRALSLNSDILLLDESFGHMDQQTREEFLSLLTKWIDNKKIILFVSHFEIVAGHFATREFLIDDVAL